MENQYYSDIKEGQRLALKISSLKIGMTLYYVNHKNQLYLYSLISVTSTDRGTFIYGVNKAYKVPFVFFDVKNKTSIFLTREKAMREIEKRKEAKINMRSELKNKITKTMVKDYLKKVADKMGGFIVTFNSNRFVAKGAEGFIDHIIFYKDYMYFIEVKIGKDKISEKQKHIAELINAVSENNKGIRYKIITENNYKEFVEELTAL